MATCLNSHQLDEDQLQYILKNATDWALTNGLVYKPNTSPLGGNQAQCAPFSLFPSVVPRRILQQAVDCMNDFNTLMYRVAQDHEFLQQALGSVIKVDPFMQGLWDIYNKVREEGLAQTISLDLFRNDFMMDMVDSESTETSPSIPSSSSLQLKQIEFNTIAASFAGLVGVTTQLHRYTLDLAQKQYTSKDAYSKKNVGLPGCMHILLTQHKMPDNDPALGLAAGMVKAWELYGNPQAVVLFLVSGMETNVIDQRWLEFKIHQQNRKVHVVRSTLLDVHAKGSLSKRQKVFVVTSSLGICLGISFSTGLASVIANNQTHRDNTEVAVVYMRAGYGEESYTSDKEWSARLLMERSRAIKCPTVRSQLSGAKKVQQELAAPGAVERFITDQAAVKRIRNTFAGLYSLDLGPDGDAAVKLAIDSPGKYVMKPQREGGGHNLYGDEMKATLQKIGASSEREAYILMERIFPWPEKNYLIKAGVMPVLADTVSEMGIYGVHIGDGEKEIVNKHCGHMLRTKTQGTDEGGIAVGFAVLDTPYLVDV